MCNTYLAMNYCWQRFRISSSFVLDKNALFYPTIRSIGRDTKFTVPFSFIIYGYRFLSRGFTVKFYMVAWSETGLFLFWGDSPRDGCAELWASTGAIWRDMLLAEALVTYLTLYYFRNLIYQKAYKYWATRTPICLLTDNCSLIWLS